LLSKEFISIFSLDTVRELGNKFFMKNVINFTKTISFYTAQL
jgi:hypothetical protein